MANRKHFERKKVFKLMLTVNAVRILCEYVHAEGGRVDGREKEQGGGREKATPFQMECATSGRGCGPSQVAARARQVNVPVCV